MSEVLRRVQDLLVGDVVAHEGKARKVESVRFDPLASSTERTEIFLVLFEDSRVVPKRTKPDETYKKPTSFAADWRLLLLESNYGARKETS